VEKNHSLDMVMMMPITGHLKPIVLHQDLDLV
jgi:hypothetical protein